MIERKKLFLLGGTGFVGTALTRQLVVQRTANDLMMLIHRTAPFRHLEQVNAYAGSLGALDLSLLDRFKPDTVIHLARMSGRGSIGRYVAALRGARANRRIIRHLEQLPAKPHVIYVSGSLVYGDCGVTPVNEATPLRPIAFAREYIKAEQPWMNALRQGTIPVTLLRPPWIIGPGSWFGEFYLKHLQRHQTVPLFGEGRNLMSLIDVEDCAGLVAHAVRHAQPGRTYNLFSLGACITQLEFAERLAAATQTGIRKFSLAEVKRQLGRTMAEAFTFSNQSATQHPEFIASYNFRYPTIDDMLRHNLAAAPAGSPPAQSLALKL